MKALITGSAGFIGFHLTRALLQEGHEVVGYDGMTPYYDVRLKEERLRILQDHDKFESNRAMLEDKNAIDDVVSAHVPEVIVHLAAQAGVRYSIENPDVYIASNLTGTHNLLEAARRNPPKHFLFASTSSIYGANKKLPFSEVDHSDFPVSLYAATKKAGEALTHSYSHLFKIPTTCFRFFTVYGPWGRPDMALFKFVERILADQPIQVYGEGQMRRDFTFVDDLVHAIRLIADRPPTMDKPIHAAGVIDSLSPVAPWRVVNIAGGNPVGLMDFIEVIERTVQREARKDFLPMQKGDVPTTFADSRLLRALTGYEPATSVESGVKAFVDWYRRNYNA